MFHILLKKPSQTLALVAAVASLSTMLSCTAQKVNTSNLDSNGLSSNGNLTGKMLLTLADNSGSVIYSDTQASSSLTFKAGTSYVLKLDASQFPPGTSFSLEMTNIGVVGAPATVLALNTGPNSFLVPTQGDYAWKLTAKAPGFNASTQSYQATVSCASPTFTATSLNPNSITVTPAGGNNQFNFSASGIADAANGMAPYTCAFDPTGTSIVDTTFHDCSANLLGFYSDLVGSRRVGVVVKDACNTPVITSRSLNLAYSVPAMPGNQFIYGQTTSALSTDPRYDNATYLATNPGTADPVKAMYSAGTFTVSSQLVYPMPSSVAHGMIIQIRGIVETTPFNAATGAGAIDVSGAFVNGLQFSTDQAGDQSPASTLTGAKANCTLTSPGGRVTPVVGKGCAANETGTSNILSVEVWGHYKCLNMTGAAHAVTIEGDFDATYDIVDACIGGGQGGGGVPPPAF